MLPKAKRSDPKTGTVAGATEIYIRSSSVLEEYDAYERHAEEKRCFRCGMRACEGRFGCSFVDLVPGRSITIDVVSVSSGAYDSCLERPVWLIRRLC